MGHYLRSLAKSVQQGCKLERYNDVPQDIRIQLYAEDQQHYNRKRKRRDLSSYTSGQPMVINNYIPAYPGQRVTNPDLSGPSPIIRASQPRPLPITISGFREDVVMAYCEWHFSKVRREDRKQ